MPLLHYPHHLTSYPLVVRLQLQIKHLHAGSSVTSVMHHTIPHLINSILTHLLICFPWLFVLHVHMTYHSLYLSFPEVLWPHSYDTQSSAGLMAHYPLQPLSTLDYEL